MDLGEELAAVIEFPAESRANDRVTTHQAAATCARCVAIIGV